MKKFSFFIAAAICLLLCNATSSYAQTTQATTTLNVKLNALYSITVNQPTVEIDFNSGSDYLTGVTSTQADHITTFCNAAGGFVVSVKGDGDLTGPVGTDAIPLNSIKVTAANGTKTLSTDPTDYANKLALTTTNQTLFTSTVGTTQATFNVAYFADPTVAPTKYLYVPTDAPATYTGTITYTIAAP